MIADSGLMAGKKGLIMGVANERSIAWHIANATSKQGAELAFTYQGDALLKRETPLALQLVQTLYFNAMLRMNQALMLFFPKYINVGEN